MSLLPQRKKSPEEIAKLRESLGVPGASPDANDGSESSRPAADSEVVDTIVPAAHEAAVVHPEPVESLPSPVPAPVSRGPKPIHSLKRSERVPSPHVDDAPAVQIAVAECVAESAPKLVRSLKKSEQGPVFQPDPTATSSLDSKIPFHRHSDKEIAEIRRREALAMMQARPNPKLAVAHPGLLAPGYILAIAGASCFYFYEFPMEATAGCAAAALLIAGFIFLRRPISRHHAAFIAVIALFVIVFGALHYFPHLQHAT